MGSLSTNVYKSKNLQQIVKIAKSTDYFKANIVQNSVKNIQLLPLGKILYKNIEKQWQHAHNSIKYVNFIEPIEYYKYFSTAHSEWNRSEEEEASAITSKFLIINVPVSSEDLIDDQSSKTILSCTYCCNDSLSVEMFSKIQRQRKIWWMNVSFFEITVIFFFKHFFFVLSLQQIHREFPFLN